MSKYGISVITVTNRFSCINNIFRNYNCQCFDNKELIIIINNDNILSKYYYEYSSHLDSVSIYMLPENITLGECLNFGVSKSKYNTIAKFDDDDYYGPYYLSEAYSLLSSNICDIVGKVKPFYYLEKYKNLYLYSKGVVNQYSSTIMGSTLCFDKNVFDKVRFRNVVCKEDYLFNKDSLVKGFRIYASSSNNHIVYKFCNNNLHTWKSDINYLVKHASLIKSNIEFEQSFSFVDKVLEI